MSFSADPNYGGSETANYWVKAVDVVDLSSPWSNNRSVHGYPTPKQIADEKTGTELPEFFALLSPYPNPFNPVTTIEYHLPVEAEVRITMYNLAGQVVLGLVNEVQPAGIHKLQFDATALASGMYFYRIETAGFAQTRKMILLK